MPLGNTGRERIGLAAILTDIGVRTGVDTRMTGEELFFEGILDPVSTMAANLRTPAVKDVKVGWRIAALETVIKITRVTGNPVPMKNQDWGL